MTARVFDRQAVEAAIRHDSDVLRTCIACLLAKRPLGDWPEEAAEAFLGALADEACDNEPEAYKARTMRAHLFRRLDIMPGEPEFAHTTPAERVRADLIGLVPLGAGQYLTQQPSTSH